MTNRYPFLIRGVQGLALLLIALAVAFPTLTGRLEYGLAIGLILLLGIPHGATDHIIFRHLARSLPGTGSLARFYGGYLLLMAAYGGLWLLAPAAALVLFLLLSMYHFGQSNWNYTTGIPRPAEWLLNLTWGAFVVLAPVLWHYEAAAPIIARIIRGEAPSLTPGLRQLIVGGLALGNLALAAGLHVAGRIDRRALFDEWINLGVLAAVFCFTPVLLGFTIYFVGWHSLSSVLDQVAFFRSRRGDYSVGRYVRETLPLTALAIAGLVALVAIQQWLGARPHVGQLFVFISVVTLPHMLLIDRLYEEGLQKANEG